MPCHVPSQKLYCLVSIQGNILADDIQTEFILTNLFKSA